MTLEEFEASCTYFKTDFLGKDAVIEFSQHAQMPTARVSAATVAEALKLAEVVAKDQAAEVKAFKERG